MLSLCAELVDFCSFLSPTENEARIRKTALKTISDAVTSVWTEATVEPFGSFVTGPFLFPSLHMLYCEYCNTSRHHHQMAAECQCVGAATSDCSAHGHLISTAMLFVKAAALVMLHFRTCVCTALQHRRMQPPCCLPPDIKPPAESPGC